MPDLIKQTFADAGVFWAAVEALATLGALAVIFREFPRLKREVAAQKVQSIGYARDQIIDREFGTAYKMIKDAWKSGGEDYPEGVEPYIVIALSRIDYLAILIDRGYLDQDLFLYEFADDFYMLERAMTNFGHRQGTQIPSMKATFPKAFELLGEAAKSAQSRSKDAFARLDKLAEQ